MRQGMRAAAAVGVLALVLVGPAVAPAASGGYSQGAAVKAYMTMDAIPEGVVLPPGVTEALDASQRDRIVAVVLFDKPSAAVVGLVNRTGPPITMGAAFTDTTLDLIAAQDPVSEAGSLDSAAHGLYAVNGMAEDAATFAARQLPA